MRPVTLHVGGPCVHEDGEMSEIPEDLLTRWAESCLHMNHLATLVQRELPVTKEYARAIDLSERVRRRTWILFNELIEQGAKKPEGYCEPNQSTEITD
jgi:hypothetical protein